MRVHLLIPLLALPILAGCGEATVAHFAGGSVTAEEFSLRYHAYLDQTQQRDNLKLREQILNNLINEQLMLIDLEAKGFHQLAQTEERLQQIRMQAILDRYSWHVSADTITVSEQELTNEFRAFKSRATARYLYASTEQDAAELKHQIDSGATFEQLAAEVFSDPGLANNGGYLGAFGWGDMDPTLEEVAFSLPVGAVSDPFPMEIGYAILKVESRFEQPLASEYDFAKVREKLRRSILEKKTRRVLRETSRGIKDEMGPVFDEGTVQLVLREWEHINAVAGVEEENPYEGLSDKRLVSFHQGEWTVGDLMARARNTSARQRSRVKDHDDLKDFVSGLIVRDEFLSRATAEGLNNDPKVMLQCEAAFLQYQLNSWKQAAEDKAIEEVWDEATLRSEYEANRDHFAFPPEVNVAEILVRTRKEALELGRKARSGSDFRELARRHSIRLWAAKQGGELGFGSRARYGVLADKFFNARTGEIVGPEFADPYYGVFKILERREGSPKSYDEARPEIIESLLPQKKLDAVKTSLDALRSNANIVIDRERLSAIKIEHHSGNQSS